MWDDDLDEQERVPMLIDGVLPSAALGVIYGDPGVGKSFFAIDWAFCVATGTPWHGHRVIEGDVIYIAAEGWQGMKDRIASWKAHKSFTTFDRAGVALLGRAIRLLDPRDVENFAVSVEQQAETHPRLIVIDTLARNANGLEENSARDMGQVVSSCDILRERFGCTVLLLHHSTKSREFGPSLRGSGALKAALDTVILVTEKDDVIRMYCEKQKDSAKFATKYFKMLPVGKSVVMSPTTAPEKKKGKAKEPVEDAYPEPELGLE
jgi:RecA-family ATPase